MKKAQSALESTIVYLAGTMLLGAAIGIWAWGNAHIPIRQVTYTFTRVMAGTPNRSVDESGASGGYKADVWPTYIAPPVP
ncbi:MAG: hypothetical protein NG712_05265 [Omnitrophica bacterium]|nr:hypothetical protein [Candidatus Omnitrophota bacterium]